MALVQNKLRACLSAAIALTVAVLTGEAMAASAVPAGGANWSLVNQVYAANKQRRGTSTADRPRLQLGRQHP